MLRFVSLATSRALVTGSVLLLAVSAVLAMLNASKTRTLRSDVARAEAAQQDVIRRSAERERQAKIQKTTTTTVRKTAAEDAKLATAEAELAKSLSDKQQLQSKIAADEAEIAELRKRVDEANTAVGAASAQTPPSAELQAQVADLKRQLESAEREKSLLADKIGTARERTAELETEKKRRAASHTAGVRGTILAVNQAYNFVVLNLGGRNGIEANSEMLVLRGGTLIGKIRISSVEPATAIGDIVTNSLARGVQVQPGDIVIYAGSNS